MISAESLFIVLIAKEWKKNRDEYPKTRMVMVNPWQGEPFAMPLIDLIKYNKDCKRHGKLEATYDEMTQEDKIRDWKRKH